MVGGKKKDANLLKECCKWSQELFYEWSPYYNKKNSLPSWDQTYNDEDKYCRIAFGLMYDLAVRMVKSKGLKDKRSMNMRFLRIMSGQNVILVRPDESGNVDLQTVSTHNVAVVWKNDYNKKAPRLVKAGWRVLDIRSLVN